MALTRLNILEIMVCKTRLQLTLHQECAFPVRWANPTGGRHVLKRNLRWPGGLMWPGARSTKCFWLGRSQNLMTSSPEGPGSPFFINLFKKKGYPGRGTSSLKQKALAESQGLMTSSPDGPGSSRFHNALPGKRDYPGRRHSSSKGYSDGSEAS